MTVELRERTPSEQAAYFDGYNMACRVLKQQMIDKMEHYRGLLRESLKGMRGGLRQALLEQQIQEELVINPEWEVLEHMPHMIPMCQDPNAYKSVDEQ